MRGLNDLELEIVQRSNATTCGDTGRKLTPHELEVALALMKRGLLTRSPPCWRHMAIHPMTTTLGRLAIACELAARGVYVL